MIRGASDCRGSTEKDDPAYNKAPQDFTIPWSLFRFSMSAQILNIHFLQLCIAAFLLATPQVNRKENDGRNIT